jgi:hypothetical protein
MLFDVCAGVEEGTIGGVCRQQADEELPVRLRSWFRNPYEVIYDGMAITR